VPVPVPVPVFFGQAQRAMALMSNR
jgi:hypothetical protein